MAVEDPSKPADVRFLHVLQVADAAAPAPTPAVLLTGSVNGGALGTAHGELCMQANIAQCGTAQHGTAQHSIQQEPDLATRPAQLWHMPMHPVVFQAYL